MSSDKTSVTLEPFRPTALTIKAADSNWSKNQRVYTNITTEHVHRGENHKKRYTSHHDSHKSDKEDGHKKKWHGGKHYRNHNRQSTSGDGDAVAALRSEVTELRAENLKIKEELSELRTLVQKLANTSISSNNTPTASNGTTNKPENNVSKDNNDDFDLFGSESEEDEEKKRITEQRLAAYKQKKSKKPGPIAKSSVLLDVKPWDDETNMKDLQAQVLELKQDGLVWGACKLVPIGYGISKLQVLLTIEDDKVSVDDLIEKIQDDLADYVQSVDIAAFNKI